MFTTRGIIHKYIEEDLTKWNTENGEYFFMENHCTIGAAAAECHGFCDALSNFKKFQMERVEHIRSGEHRCIYKISYTTESLQNLLIMLVNRFFYDHKSKS